MESEKEQLSDELMKRTQDAYIRSFNRLTDEINALYAEIMSRPDGAIGRTELYNLRHFATLREQIANEITGLAINDNENLKALLEKITGKTFEENLTEFGLPFDIFAEQQAAGIVAQNWSGVKFSERIWGNANDFNARVMETIEEMILGGKSPDELKKALMRDYSVSFHEADRLIRTEASHAYNAAAVESYKDAGLQHVEFLAEADCCDKCAPFRSRRFPIEAPPMIPVHPNCRCTYLPVIE